ncbi:MAG: hypothetical protein U0L05_03585 [Schaedlerella sp.]|nr:hypothetical protein [Schaedlerella sp.]
MKLDKKNIIEIIIVIFAVFGMIYSFYNVLSTRILKSESREEIHELSEYIMSAQKKAGRLECQSNVYVGYNEELIQDKTETKKFIYDYKNERIQVIQKSSSEIIEHVDGNVFVYSQGISPVYLKDKKMPEKVSLTDWYYYECESIYGEEEERIYSDSLSYGYLLDEDKIVRITKENAELNGTAATKFVVTIENSLREDFKEDMGDSGLRKLLSKNGLSPSHMKSNYPTVYSLLKKAYNSETEDIIVWVDEDGKMFRLEKDCTFSYYVRVMKENSDIIENKVGKYEYPNAVCIQFYEYNREADMILFPQSFEKL